MWMCSSLLSFRSIHWPFHHLKSLSLINHLISLLSVTRLLCMGSFFFKNISLNDIYHNLVFFRATVVKAQKEFWVKSIKSIPIPPCRLEKNGFQGYIPESVTPPPPVRPFALEVANWKVQSSCIIISPK